MLDGTGLPFVLIVTTALGWMRVVKLRQIILDRITMRITFKAPPVDDEQPPIKLRMVSTILENDGQALKSALERPVVVRKEIAWNPPKRRDSARSV